MNHLAAKLKRVSDYYGDSQLAEAEFVAMYPHPFLVLLNHWASDSTFSKSHFYTTVADGRDIAALVEIAEGRMLKPEAVVFPVVKRSGDTLRASMVTIGRADNCDIIIPAPGVSKFHCYVTNRLLDEDHYALSDSGSTNGTRINNQSIAPHQKTDLSSGDQISIGTNLVMTFFLARDFHKVLEHAPAPLPLQ